jgi:hypothetical protein
VGFAAKLVHSIHLNDTKTSTQFQTIFWPLQPRSRNLVSRQEILASAFVANFRDSVGVSTKQPTAVLKYTSNCGGGTGIHLPPEAKDLLARWQMELVMAIFQKYMSCHTIKSAEEKVTTCNASCSTRRTDSRSLKPKVAATFSK